MHITLEGAVLKLCSDFDCKAYHNITCWLKTVPHCEYMNGKVYVVCRDIPYWTDVRRVFYWLNDQSCQNYKYNDVFFSITEPGELSWLKRETIIYPTDDMVSYKRYV